MALVDGRGLSAPTSWCAQVVWREPGLTIPLTAVNRINGQYFVYVLDKQGEMTVARQKGVSLRRVSATTTSCSTAVRGRAADHGRHPEIGDGAPVMAAAPGAGAGPRPTQEGLVAMFADVFIKRPVLSTVCSC